MQNTRNAEQPPLSPPRGEGQGEGCPPPNTDLQPATSAAEPLSLASLKFPCRHLRSKEMYYQDYGAPEDDFSSGIYWCGKTQENFGPDGEPCSKGQCSGERTCYLP